MNQETIDNLFRLELGGGTPPGFSIEERGGDCYVLEESPAGKSQTKVDGDKKAARSFAWMIYIRRMLGEHPPGYQVTPNVRGQHVWILTSEEEQSHPFDSREEALAASWLDYKAIRLGNKRPPFVSATKDPVAILAKIQQITFRRVELAMGKKRLDAQLAATDSELEELTKRYGVAVMEARKRG